MSTIVYKTKGNSPIKGKARVFFTCHPDDFDTAFDKICTDIFKTHDPVIYYTESMSEPWTEEEKTTDLGQMNLFVIPVSFQLLTTPNRAMDEDLAFAKKENIPVLPILLETGLDGLYSRSDRFGELQYLNPHSRDLTEISYEEKLKKYLDSVLISDELASRIRAAFDAYIFLSYRKKDRKYANELMRLIHRQPSFRDIAIWYDEFLTPGESFQDNIRKAMKDSRLFALLVTPGLLEEPNGKPNFVMAEEYPAAKSMGMDILPIEMAKTDRTALEEKYPEIPPCADPKEKDALEARLLAAISEAVRDKDKNDAEHTFLIGLAYLKGIDVEVDREKGRDLIHQAAEDGFPDAIYHLQEMYQTGLDFPVDYGKAAYWMERLLDAIKTQEGEVHPDLFAVQSELADLYNRLGEREKALSLLTAAHAASEKAVGEEHPCTLTLLSNLGVIYGEMGDTDKYEALISKAYEIRKRTLGDHHHDTLESIYDLAVIHHRKGNTAEACRLGKEVYEERIRLFGEEHPDTLQALSGYASFVSAAGDHASYVTLLEKLYGGRSRVLGETHPSTLVILSNLASAYSKEGKNEQAEKHMEKAYAQFQRAFGKEHPDTLVAAANLWAVLKKAGKRKQAKAMAKQVYFLHAHALGDEHAETRKMLKILTAGHPLTALCWRQRYKKQQKKKK